MYNMKLNIKRKTERVLGKIAYLNFTFKETFPNPGNYSEVTEKNHNKYKININNILHTKYILSCCYNHFFTE